MTARENFRVRNVVRHIRNQALNSLLPGIGRNSTSRDLQGAQAYADSSHVVVGNSSSLTAGIGQAGE